MSNKPVIGFIGVGMMGHGMAKNIRIKGYELWFF
ncbi:NAD(P)-binding domain-containing protein, partial [Rhizobium ruizarguesonis]